MIDYAHIPSPLGVIVAAAEEGAIIGLWFEGQKYFRLFRRICGSKVSYHEVVS
jgi:hypothetical protein